jgi:hypothetical protein
MLIQSKSPLSLIHHSCFQGTSMTLTGCIIHGYGIFLYIGDEGMPTGASWTLEVVPWFILGHTLVCQTSHHPIHCRHIQCRPAKLLGHALNWQSLGPGTAAGGLVSIWVSWHSDGGTKRDVFFYKFVCQQNKMLTWSGVGSRGTTLSKKFTIVLQADGPLSWPKHSSLIVYHITTWKWATPTKT